MFNNNLCVFVSNLTGVDLNGIVCMCHLMKISNGEKWITAEKSKIEHGFDSTCCKEIK